MSRYAGSVYIGRYLVLEFMERSIPRVCYSTLLALFLLVSKLYDSVQCITKMIFGHVNKFRKYLYFIFLISIVTYGKFSSNNPPFL